MRNTFRRSPSSRDARQSTARMTSGTPATAFRFTCTAEKPSGAGASLATSPSSPLRIIPAASARRFLSSRASDTALLFNWSATACISSGHAETASFLRSSGAVPLPASVRSYSSWYNSNKVSRWERRTWLCMETATNNSSSDLPDAPYCRATSSRILFQSLRMRSRGISPESATHDCITHAAILSRSAVPAGYIASAFCLTSRGMVITSPVSTLFQYSSFAAATCSGNSPAPEGTADTAFSSCNRFSSIVAEAFSGTPSSTKNVPSCSWFLSSSIITCLPFRYSYSYP